MAWQTAEMQDTVENAHCWSQYILHGRKAAMQKVAQQSHHAQEHWQQVPDLEYSVTKLLQKNSKQTQNTHFLQSGQSQRSKVNKACMMMAESKWAGLG